MKLLIDNRQNKVKIDKKLNEIIEKVVIECLKEENKELNYELSLSFVDDKIIRELNNQFRNIDKATDVLSFPIKEGEILIELETPPLGDIVISTETALRQSEEYGHSLEREVAYLTAHSMFHLLGYDHDRIENKEIMREKEKNVMKRLKIFKNN